MPNRQDVYVDPQGVEIAFEWVEIDGYMFRRRLDTGGWLSAVTSDHFIHGGKAQIMCGVCDMGPCPPQCPAQEKPDYRRQSAPSQSQERLIPVDAAMRQALDVYRGALRPEDARPEVEQQHMGSEQRGAAR